MGKVWGKRRERSTHEKQGSNDEQAKETATLRGAERSTQGGGLCIRTVTISRAKPRSTTRLSLSESLKYAWLSRSPSILV